MIRPTNAFAPPPQGDQPSSRRDVSAADTRQPEEPANAQAGRLLNVIPVGLKEAALDSPTSRASTVHFAEQVDLIERWLDDYQKSANRLLAESLTLENVLSNFISHATLPTTISEAVVDQDYSILAMRKYSEGAKDYWMSMLAVVKRLNGSVVEPIKAFVQNDLRSFKDARRNLEQCQKNFDSLQNKYAAQGKSKEPSSLREDAFQLHEARKAYLKASMDFFVFVPQLKLSLDRLLVRIFSDQWREMRLSRDNACASFGSNVPDMERVRGWTREMENGERAFRKELQIVRKELEDAAELGSRPSRELEDYAALTPPNSGRPGHATSSAKPANIPNGGLPSKAEKQGWLYLRTYTGKPTRTNWVRRWAFVRSGIFGWLIQGTRAGGVEESEHIGVLLCNVRPALSEERRFCFEVKTKKHAIMLQAETQAELNEWVGVFEVAKSRALEGPQASIPLASTRQENAESAFAISAPPIPEFGTTVLGSLEPGAVDEATIERSGTLPIPGQDSLKEGMEAARRSTTFDRDEPPRESTSRIGRKLDLHRKSANNSPLPSSPSTPIAGGGIASLIAASHGSLPVSPGFPITPIDGQLTKPKVSFTLALRDMPPSTLAPSTLASPPSATSLSKAAVVVTGERGLGAGSSRANSISNGIMANMWGSSNWSFINRLERNDSQPIGASRLLEQAPITGFLTGSPSKDGAPATKDADTTAALSVVEAPVSHDFNRSRTPSPGLQHRNTISADGNTTRQMKVNSDILDFPNYYPLQLKTQDAQFRLLFPGVNREERLVLVFRASWNANDQQEFPGRAYVTSNEMYFYSHHFGLVFATGIAFSKIDEVTAAPGRECDFLFLHLKELISQGGSTRITIKTFLEPLGLLQRRLNFLVRNSVADEPLNVENIVKLLIKMEQEGPERSPSMESWDDFSPIVPAPDGPTNRRGRSMTTSLTDYKAPTRADKNLGQGSGSTNALNKDLTKFKLPAQPVNYTPPGNLPMAAEKVFDVSPKALFHLLFGDKSAVWQLLQHERRAEHLKQGPWIDLGEGRLRRDFDFIVPTSDVLGRAQIAEVRDYQVVDVNNDHLCYVVTDKRTAWHLPFRRNYRLVSKIVITHVAKGKCKLAIFTKVQWLKKPWLVAHIIERYASDDLTLDALDLVDLVSEQVRLLGPHSRTKKAIQIFGQLGQSTEIIQLQVDRPALNIELRRTPTPRTLFDIVRQDIESGFKSFLAMLYQVIVGLMKWAYKTCTAHTLILTVLGFSILLNTFHSYRDTYSWWHERNAGKFMARIGVTPNTVMSKAVYIQDLEELLNQSGDIPSPEGSTCYSVFHDENQLDDLDAPILSTSASRGLTTRSSASNLQRTRQRLGAYRHDLLVAMRVVNSIEKEVLQTEWERWVTTETRRCRQVESLLKASENGTGMFLHDVLASRGNDVQKWYDDYCVSCRNEHDKLVGQ